MGYTDCLGSPPTSRNSGGGFLLGSEPTSCSVHSLTVFVPLPSSRHEFDSEQIPDLTRDVFRLDIHSVGSLCKLYFRELPNPLLTY